MKRQTIPARWRKTPFGEKERVEQRLRRATALEKTAKEVVLGKQKCVGRSKVRDAERNPVIGPDGKPLMKPCGNPPIKGGTVCKFHGGLAPQVKALAQQRLLEIVEPGITRLHELILQDVHLPTSLGAIRTVLERAGDEAIGPLKKQAEEKDTRPVINIGIKVGGIDKPQVIVGMQAKPLPPGDDDVQEGEIVGDDNDTD